MIRALLYALAILHLGPGFAFALLAFGCESPAPLLGPVCRSGAFALFGILTVAGWLVLGLGLLAIHLLRRARASDPPRLGLRLGALAALLATGGIAAACGDWLTGSPLVFLAIPATLAGGWLYLANPAACVPGRASR